MNFIATTFVSFSIVSTTALSTQALDSVTSRFLRDPTGNLLKPNADGWFPLLRSGWNHQINTA